MLAAQRTFANPILPGCHPDPSICRVGDDYYLATSTFEYFPGIPVFHSRDLVHWRPIGHAIHRPDQLSLDGVPSSGGLFAPTLRYHDGRFYLLNTLVHAPAGVPSGNYLVTAQDPAGPWSDPVWLDFEGIDPSAFFDDDGSAWLTWTRPADDPAWDQQTDVWLQELDLTTMQVTGPARAVWRGALLGAIWAEGPHLYKVDGRYYLLAAEGGTGHEHAVSVARSDAVTGPYLGNPANPVLTHRNLGRGYPVVATGHADLVELPDGSWWAVLLAQRPYGGYHVNLGRETFAVPVTWEDGWPVFAPGVGHVRLAERAPALPEHPWPERAARDDFSTGIGPDWCAPRGPATSFAEPAAGGGLDLRLQPATLAEPTTNSFMGVRQRHMDVDVTTMLDVRPAGPGEWAGLALRQSESHHYLLVVAGGDGGPDAPRRALVVRRMGEEESVLAEERIPDGPVLLGLRARSQELTLVVGEPGGTEREVACVDGRILDSTVAGGFIGVWIGLYATSNGHPTTTVAHVDWFEYAG